MELATGRIVKIAINHDPDAILMHKTNHPHTRHMTFSEISFEFAAAPSALEMPLPGKCYSASSAESAGRLFSR